MSKNHQFIEYNGKAVKRYAKTVLYRISGYRLDPHRPENRLDFLLVTPERDVEIIPQTEGRPIVRQVRFNYEDEILELYSDTEIRVFERWNKSLIEKGLIKEYNQLAPDVNSNNMLSDEQVEEIALTRQLTALKKKISDISSPVSLKRIKAAAIDLNRSVNIITAIDERLDELSGTDKAAS